MSALLVLIFWAGGVAVRHFMGEVFCSTVTNSTLNRDPAPPLEEIRKAIAWDGRNAAYWFKLALALEKEHADAQLPPSSRPADAPGGRAAILRALERAVRLNPLRAEHHLALAWACARMRTEPADRSSWLAAADLAISRCAFFAGDSRPGLHQEIGHYWIVRSKSTQGTDQQWAEAIARAARHYQKAAADDRSGQFRQRSEAFIQRFYPGFKCR